MLDDARDVQVLATHRSEPAQSMSERQLPVLPVDPVDPGAHPAASAQTAAKAPSIASTRPIDVDRVIGITCMSERTVRRW